VSLFCSWGWRTPPGKEEEKRTETLVSYTKARPRKEKSYRSGSTLIWKETKNLFVAEKPRTKEVPQLSMKGRKGGGSAKIPPRRGGRVAKDHLKYESAATKELYGTHGDGRKEK